MSDIIHGQTGPPPYRLYVLLEDILEEVGSLYDDHVGGDGVGEVAEHGNPDGGGQEDLEVGRGPLTNLTHRLLPLGQNVSLLPGIKQLVTF